MVDADLADYFGQIPQAELMESMSGRAGDGRMLGWVKAWLLMPVEEDDGEGGRRLANRAKKEGKGTPQGAPISPLPGNIYMRRFLLGWKKNGFDRLFDSEIVNYADNFVVLGKASPEAMLEAVRRIMEVLKLPINEEKTRCLRVPEEPLAFLGCRIGRNYKPKTGRAYIGTRPHKESVQSICRAISDPAHRRNGLIDAETMVEAINRRMAGWANYFVLGQVGPAYASVDRHAAERLRRWLCRKHKAESGICARFPDERLQRGCQ